MKRFLIFNFSAYEGTDLAHSIQGMTDRLDGIAERIESMEDVMALDMRTGFIWQYHKEAAEWKCGDNIGEYPALDVPVPTREAPSVSEFYSRFLQLGEPGGYLFPPGFREEAHVRLYGNFDR